MIIANLKKTDIGRKVKYHNPNRKEKAKRGLLFSWNIVSIFVCFGVENSNDMNLDNSTACYPEFLSFTDNGSEDE